MRSRTGADRLARRKTSRRSPKVRSLSSAAERRLTNSGGAETPRKWARRVGGSSPCTSSSWSRSATWRRTSSARRGLREIEVAEQELQDRAVRDGAAVRGARGLELEDVGPVEAAQELVEQARLADPRLPGQQDDRPLARGRAPEGPREHGELAVAPHQRAQRALRGDLEPGAALHLARERVGADRLALALHLEVAEILEGEQPDPGGAGSAD